MLKPIHAATHVLPVALAVSVACSGKTPTPKITNTVVAPTAIPLFAEVAATAAPPKTETPPPVTPPTALPAATPVQPTTQEPTPTSASTPKDETPTGVLSTLNLHETEDVNSELSEVELACLKESDPSLHLRWAFILPGYGFPEERVKIIGCLEDETVARIFLADTVQGDDPLTLETSTCVRAAFNEIDPRSMMLAKVEGFPEDTLNSATVLSLVTMACLNDEEWETADGLAREMELREWMRCMMEKLGGPRQMAAAMTKGEEDGQGALTEAAEGCAEEMAPIPGEGPATPAPTP